MKALYRLLTYAMYVFVGVFLGGAVGRILDVQAHPEIYAAQSAPWYLSIQMQGAFTLLMVALLWLLRRWVGKKR